MIGALRLARRRNHRGGDLIDCGCRLLKSGRPLLRALRLRKMVGRRTYLRCIALDQLRVVANVRL
jgi:hypothetical protein